jgi:ferredoxin, 2Fe-2S
MDAGITINVQTGDDQRHTLVTRPGQRTVMDVLFDEDQGIEAVCGGCASCATCHVFIHDDWLSRLPERGEIEEMLLQYQEHFDERRSRLSCQLDLSQDLDGLTLEVAPQE